MQYSDEDLSIIFNKTRGHCWHCGRPLAWKNYGKHSGERGAWEVDHSIPIARGGTDHLNNLVPACIDCNRGKQDRTPREFEREFEY
jgi:5-methylcytosine-specific restriction endonuclease McrA